ncbi:MAG: TolC family protein [Crocinitomicaceae bacterium]
MTLKINSLIVFLLVVVSSFGQKELSASQAVFTALENNYQILISEKQTEIAEKNNKWSEAGLFPTVTLSAAQQNVIQDNTNNPFTFTPGIILNQSLSPTLSANWNIFSGFKVKISKQRLEQLEFQSSNNAIAIIENTIQDVLKTYYNSQLQKERLQLFEEIMALSQRRYKYYELKEKYSSSSSLESLQFRNQYLTDSTNYLVQKVSFDNSIRNLRLVMNDSTQMDQDLILTDDMDVAIGIIDFNRAQEEMLANNQNLKNQYIALELQKTNTSLQRSFLYPTLDFQAGVNPSWANIREIKNNSFEQGTSGLMYYGNFNLRYNLFNNWKSKRAVDVSKIQEEISEMNVESMKQSLSRNLQNLIETYQIRSQLANISQENLVYAKKAFELAQKRFELGSMNSIDLTSFQNSYQNTMIQHYQNLYNKLETYLEVYKMTGKISLEYSK